MSKAFRSQIISFLFYTIIQIVVFQNFNLSEWGFGFVYIAFILFLPLELSVILIMILAIIQGAILDVFYNTLGLHMFSTVLIAYLRGYLIKLLAPKMMSDLDNVSSVSQFGFQRIVVYTLILVFIHHVCLFFIMAGNTDFVLNTILKILA